MHRNVFNAANAAPNLGTKTRGPPTLWQNCPLVLLFQALVPMAVRLLKMAGCAASRRSERRKNKAQRKGTWELGKEGALGRNSISKDRKYEKIYNPSQIILFFEHDLQE